jgi:hypothetical protein
VIFHILADALVCLHLGFVLFVGLGGFLVFRWPKVAWAHLPAVAWGGLIEITGRVCPLTPLENQLRMAGGGTGYEGGFVERYVVPIIYPPGLTRGMQLALGISIFALNVAIYSVVFLKSARTRNQDS